MSLSLFVSIEISLSNDHFSSVLYLSVRSTVRRGIHAPIGPLRLVREYEHMKLSIHPGEVGPTFRRGMSDLEIS